MAGLSFNAIDPQILIRRTFKRRRMSAEQLDQAKSDRLLRLVDVVAVAKETFGNVEKAHVWLNRENRMLEAKRRSPWRIPIEARALESLLGRIVHGTAA